MTELTTVKGWLHSTIELCKTRLLVIYHHRGKFFSCCLFFLNSSKALNQLSSPSIDISCSFLCVLTILFLSFSSLCVLSFSSQFKFSIEPKFPLFLPCGFHWKDFLVLLLTYIAVTLFFGVQSLQFSVGFILLLLDRLAYLQNVLSGCEWRQIC